MRESEHPFSPSVGVNEIFWATSVANVSRSATVCWPAGGEDHPLPDDAFARPSHVWTGHHFWSEMGGKALLGLLTFALLAEFRHTRRSPFFLSALYTGL